MKRTSLFVLSLALFFGAVPHDAVANLFMGGQRIGAVLPPFAPGATADTGANMDATQASAYSALTTYAHSDIVSSGGSYYVSMADSNVGNALTNTSYWTQISTFLYVSATGNDGTCAPNANPATAKASPCATVNAVSRRTANLGGTAISPNSMIAFERGGSFMGQLVFNVTRANVAISSLSGDGTTVTATTSTAHRLVSGTTVTVSGASPAGYNTGGAVRVTVTSPTTFTYANTTTGASSGSIVFLNAYGNHFVGAYGTGPRPIIRYSDDNSSSSGSQGALYLVWSNRAGLRLRDLDLAGENSSVLYYTVGSGTFQVGETVTCSGGGTSTVTRLSAVTGRLVVAGLSGTCLNTHTITGGTSGATGTLNAAVVDVGGVQHGGPYAQLTNLEVRGFRFNGVLLGTSGSAGSADYVLLKNSIIHGNQVMGTNGAGVDQGYGTGLIITRNRIYDNGNGFPGSVINHNLYMQDITNTEISYNDIYMTANHGDHGIVIHGTCNNVSIHHNDLHENGNGIGINDGYGPGNPAETFRNFAIYSNKIRNSSTLSGQTQGVPFDISSMQDGLIYNNLITGNNGTSTINDWRGTSASSGADDKTARLYFYNNTFVHTAASGSVISISGASTVDLRFRDNIFSSAATGNSAILKANTLPDAQIVLDNNLTVQTGANPWSWTTGGVTTTYATIASFRSATGKETSGIQASDALFTSPTAWTLQALSPAKNAGTGLNISTDFRGATRSGSAPSMGAYE